MIRTETDRQTTRVNVLSRRYWSYSRVTYKVIRSHQNEANWAMKMAVAGVRLLWYLSGPKISWYDYGSTDNYDYDCNYDN